MPARPESPAQSRGGPEATTERQRWMETGFSCRDVSLQSAHSAAEPARAGLGTSSLLLHSARSGRKSCVCRSPSGRAGTPGNRGSLRPTHTPRGAPKPIAPPIRRRGREPARLIHGSRRGGGGGTGGRGGWGEAAARPPAPSQLPPHPTEAGRSPFTPLPPPRYPPVPSRAGGPCSRSDRRAGR